jgi:hypothetical protein
MRLYPAFMLPADAISPLIGFAASIASATGIIVAQSSADVMPPVVKAWMEGGFSLALVVCLLYAVATLWRRLNQRDADLAALNKEHREDQKARSEALIDTLEKLTDRISERR